MKIIEVKPGSEGLAIEATQQFTATAIYSDGSMANVTTAVSWTSSTPSVATIAPAGMATGVAAGSSTITALLDGVSGTATLTITTTAKTIKLITISPDTASFIVGATQQFTATAIYSDGSMANVTTAASWTSSTPSVAKITPAGVATGVAAGSSTITASLDGTSGTAKLTVMATAKTIASIAISPNPVSFAVGATQQFTATATYSDGSTANVTSTATWTSTDPSAVTISSTGLATAQASGTANIMASFSGASGTAVLTLTAAKTIKSIAISPNPVSFAVGATQQFTATATYSDGSTANVTSTATWTSTDPSAVTISSTGLATAQASGTANIMASFSGASGTAVLTLTAAKSIKSIAISPNPASFAMGATQQFTATATYSDNSTAAVTSTATWTVADEDVATITSAGIATGAASGSSTVTASLNGVSASGALMVTIVPGTGVNIATWHVDNNRSGLNSGEQSLSPSNVSSGTFGKLFSYLVDGYAYAEPLLVSNVTINGSAHNALFVATERDSVYAFDADTYGNGSPFWQVSLLQPGETPVTADPDLQPNDGVTSTPVIDPSSNTLYVVSKQKSASGTTFRLNALDITTGAQKFGGPVTIQASVPGSNPRAGNGTTVSLSTGCVQRAALLLSNGTIYIGFGSCPTGWLLAYNAQTLAQTGVFNASPNVPDPAGSKFSSGGGIWMGGGGPAADSAGNVYVATGNGPWDGNTAWSDSVLKFDPGLQKVQDYFTPEDYDYMGCNDADLASGGVMLVPGTTPAQILAGGKTGKLYLLNTANLGKEQANDAGATQTFYFESDLTSPYSDSCVDSAGTYTTNIGSYESFGTAAYFNGSVYLGVTPTSLTVAAGVRQFAFSGNNTVTPGTETTPSVQEKTRGTTPFISSDGTAKGILWMIDEGQPLGSSTATTATLRAYDAANLTNELYTSGVNSGDTPGLGIKFTSPIVANGKLYISTGHDQESVPNPQGEIDVYGLK